MAIFETGRFEYETHGKIQVGKRADMPFSDAPSLDDLRLFFLMCEGGSISAAARRFGTSKAKLSRALSRLEDRAGSPLFDRVPNGLQLTAAGQSLEPIARELTKNASEAEERLRSVVGKPSGQLRIAASALSGQLLVAPVIAEMHRLYPDVTVVVTVSALGPDPLAEDLDVVLRLGRPDETYLIARKIAAARLKLYACQSVANEINAQRVADGLPMQRVVIGVPGVPTQWLLTSPDGQILELDNPPASIAGDPTVAIQIISAGQGVSLVPEIFAEPLVQQGLLAAVLPEYAGPEVEIFACFPPRRASVPAVRKFIDLLSAYVTMSPDLKSSL